MFCADELGDITKIYFWKKDAYSNTNISVINITMCPSGSTFGFVHREKQYIFVAHSPRL